MSPVKGGSSQGAFVDIPEISKNRYFLHNKKTTSASKVQRLFFKVDLTVLARSMKQPQQSPDVKQFPKSAPPPKPLQNRQPHIRQMLWL